MGGNKEADPEREKKRKKALKRMVKMVGKAWSLPNAEPFHNSHNNGTVILCLTSLGQKLDEEDYRYGRHGWEDFARDFGGVYNYHIHRYVFHVDSTTTFCCHGHNFKFGWKGNAIGCCKSAMVTNY